MTTVSIEEFRAHLDKYLNDAARKDVVLTNEGKPWLVVRAIIPEVDDDSTAFSQSAEFCQMIQKRRQEQGIAWEEARQQLRLGHEKTDT